MPLFLSLMFFFRISVSFIFFFLPLFLAFVPPPSLLFTTMAFNTACRDRIYPFYPLIAFGSLQALPRLPTSLPAAQPLPLHCVGYITPHSQTKVVLFCLLPLFVFNTLIWIRVKSLPHLLLWHASNGSNSCLLLLGEMSFQHDISPQRSLSENPKIGFPLLPTAKPHLHIPLTHGPPPLYQLGTSRWCLDPMCMLDFRLNPLLFWSSCICHCLHVFFDSVVRFGSCLTLAA